MKSADLAGQIPSLIHITNCNSCTREGSGRCNVICLLLGLAWNPHCNNLAIHNHGSSYGECAAEGMGCLLLITVGEDNEGGFGDVRVISLGEFWNVY